jgi:hypothetical protein
MARANPSSWLSALPAVFAWGISVGGAGSAVFSGAASFTGTGASVAGAGVACSAATGAAGGGDLSAAEACSLCFDQADIINNTIRIAKAGCFIFLSLSSVHR